MAIIIRRDRRNPLQGDIVITRKATADYWVKLRERAKKRFGEIRFRYVESDTSMVSGIEMVVDNYIFAFLSNPKDAENYFWE